MAKISGVLYFNGLTAPGSGFVEDFQQHHHEEFKFVSGLTPGVKTIEWEGVDKLAMLVELAKRVQTGESD
jgi:hypothetical protein